MERMTGFDASLLYLETSQQMLVVGGILIVDVSALDFEYTFDRVRTELARRVKEIPEFRRKIYDSPLNLGHPAWVEEYDLDVTQHVRRVVVDAPGDDDAVFEMCGTLSSRPLDRSRPLWEMWVLEGLAAPGTIAVFFRAHHALLDGTSSAAVLRKLSAAGQKPSSRDLDLVRTQAGGANPLQLITGGLWDFYVRRPVTIARLLPEAAMLPIRLRRAAGTRAAGKKTAPREVRDPDAGAGTGTHEAVEADDEVAPKAAPFTAPRTRFNATITPHRAVWGTTLDLTEIKEIKSAFGVTVNDVFLTVVGGGLRRYLRLYDDLPEKPLIAVVPVSTRDDDGTQGNNRVTVLFASLGTDIPDPVERLRAVGGPAAQLCVEILETELAAFGRYATSSPLPPLHDPVALLAVTHPHLFERRRTPIAVELGGSISRGATLVDRRLHTAEGTRPEDADVQTHWVHTVDADAALDLIVDACRRWA